MWNPARRSPPQTLRKRSEGVHVWAVCSGAVLILAIGLAPTITTAEQNATQLKSEKQQPKIQNENKNPKNAKSAAQPSTPVITPQPSTDASQNNRQPADENIRIQRELRDATDRLAQDTHDLANYTLLLVIVGFIIGGAQCFIFIFQTKHGGKSAEAAKRSADVARSTLEFTQRAFLSICEPNWMADTYQLLIPVINYGRVACKKFTVEIAFTIFNRVDNTTSYDFRETLESRPEHLILPGEGAQFSIFVRLPSYTPTRFDAAGISGKIVYDSGFNSTDIFEFLLSYDQGAKNWQRIGGRMLEINFSGQPKIGPDN